MTYENNSCPICHKAFSPYPMGEKDGFAFVACKSCGSVLIDPPIVQDQLDAFYADVQPQITHVADVADTTERMRKILLKLGNDVAGKRFLDILCRHGYAVHAAKKLGMNAKGIDSHEFYASFAREKNGGPEIFDHKTALEYANTGAQADIIFSLESFCEQTDIEAHMAGIAKILAPGGKLYIQEPDGNSFWIPRTFANWIFVDPPLNLNFISKKGMKALLARHGLKIERSFFTWGPFMRLIASKV